MEVSIILSSTAISLTKIEGCKRLFGGKGKCTVNGRELLGKKP